jgi:hypothetical protein
MFALTSFIAVNRVSAAAISTKSITMSSSKVSDTSVTYTAVFSPSSTYGAFAIDFCTTPIAGQACTNATGLTLGAGCATLSGWTVTCSTAAPSITATKTSGTLTGGTATTLTITVATNPSSTGTFYGRIMSWSGNATTGYSIATSTITEGTSFTDSGAVGLSTTQLITINAIVQEYLAFCVDGTSTTTKGTCTNTSVPTISLGTGSPSVLSTSAVSTASVYSHLDTNAVGGTAIRLKSNTAGCAGLLYNSVCNIKGVGDITGATNPSTLATAPGTTPTGALGLTVSNLTAFATYSTNSLTAQAPYSTGSSYGMGTGVSSGNGDLVTQTTTAAPIYGANTQYTFGAVAAANTPAGLYSNTFTLIATGTF